MYKPAETTIYVKWSDLNDYDVNKYYLETRRLLSDITLTSEAFSCKDVECKNVNHTNDISIMYNKVIDSLHKASHGFISKKKNKNDYQVPGWNEHCKDAHSEARENYLLWVSNGKPKQGPIFDLYKSTKYRFKYIMRLCKKGEECHKANKLADKLVQKDYIKFWKEVHKINVNKLPPANTVNEASGKSDIANMWMNHYKQLLNSNNDVSAKNLLIIILKVVNSLVT